MIIKRRHTGAFAVIPNLTANDERLSAGALGLLVYLLAKPSDWTVNVAQLRQRFGLGRNPIYRLMTELETCGYVRRIQARADASKQFKQMEYVVYDGPASLADQEPQTEKPSLENGDTPSPIANDQEPCPEIREAAISQSKAASPISASPLAACRESGHILKQTLQKQNLQIPYGEADASREPASLNAQVWKEALEVLSQSPLPEAQKRTLIGKWLKRAPDNSGKEKFRAILVAAKRAGTGDPVPYITKALDRELPPPPDPRGFDRPTWQRNVAAAIKCGKSDSQPWPPRWGPPPGRKGCLVPDDLVTPELLRALGVRSEVAGIAPAPTEGVGIPTSELVDIEISISRAERHPGRTGTKTADPNSRNIGNSTGAAIAERRPAA